MTTQAERNALADKLASVESYTVAELGGLSDDRERCILVSIATRDAVIAALRAPGDGANHFYLQPNHTVTQVGDIVRIEPAPGGA